MVGNTLYYVMTWFESPTEARIYFDTSVPHHRVALDVPPDWFRGMIEALIDVIEGAVPALDAAEQQAWDEMRAALVGLVERWAARLVETGLRRGQAVAILGTSTVEYALVFLAAVRAGGVAAPLTTPGWRVTRSSGLRPRVPTIGRSWITFWLKTLPMLPEVEVCTCS